MTNLTTKSGVLSAIFLLFSFGQIFSLDLSVSIGRFQSVEGAYIEFNYFVLAPTVGLDSIDGSRSIDLVLLINDQTHTIHADRLNLIGPKNGANFNVVRRYAMQPGEYHFVIKATDNSNSKNTFSFEDDIIIQEAKQTAEFSDILLLSSITADKEHSEDAKHGYILSHLPYSYSKAGATEVYYYLEAYLRDTTSGVYRTQIKVEESYKNRKNRVVYLQNKKRHKHNLDVIVGKLNTDAYVSGNYKLTISIIDGAEHPICSRSTFFQHNNPKELILAKSSSNKHEFDFIDLMTTSELNYSLRAISPRIHSVDMGALNIAIKSQNRLKMAHNLKYHWSILAEGDIEKSYNAYMVVAKAIDREFQSGFGAGFETDRGYFYLKYGKPDHVVSEKTDPVAPPYEIWTDNEIPELSQTNVKFIFYNPSLAPGDYELLHSTAKGEKNNPRWQLKLYENAPGDLEGNNNIDDPQVKDSYRRNAVKNFNDF